VLPNPFRKMGVWIIFTETQQSGQNQGLDQRPIIEVELNTQQRLFLKELRTYNVLPSQRRGEVPASMSAARLRGLKRRFYGDVVINSPLLSDTLLRPWIRRFTMIISAWCLRTSSKFSGKKSN